MPTNTPNVEAPEWAAAQASPWLVVNKSFRIFDAFAVAVIVDEMDRTAPPVTCNDGARYLVQGTATGDWAGHEGEMAIAVGANAVNGWYFAQIGLEGVVLFNREDSLRYRYLSGVWEPFNDALTRLQDLFDVDLNGLQDGDLLKWDLSNGVFFPVRDLSTPQPIVFNFSDDGEARFYADRAMTLVEAANSGTGSVAYEKSTAAAPSTFSSTSSPISLQAGAWLKATATGVSSIFAAALVRTA